MWLVGGCFSSGKRLMLFNRATKPKSKRSSRSAAAGSSSARAADRVGDVKAHDVSSLQRALTAVVDAKVLVDIKRNIKRGDLNAQAQGPLMEACGKPGAGRWLHVVPTEPRLRLGQWQWEQAMRNLFGVGNGDESKGRVRCCCEGRRLLSELPASHLLTCKELR